MIVDLHNHTKLCNHAEGEMYQYVEQAIKSGVKYFGFSDHAPMDFEKKYRMSFSQMAMYETEVKELKERYKDDIEVLLGYEVDYLENYMDERVLKTKVDYLIGSVHFLGGWGFDNPEFIGEYKAKDMDVIWQDYFNTVQKMVQSGKFDIVGHIDLIKVFKYLPKKDVKLIAKDCVKAIKKADMVVEINMAGLKKPINEIYPSDDILQMLLEYDIPLTFGSDAHKSDEVCKYDELLTKKIEQFDINKCAVFKGRDRKLISLK